MQGEASQSKQRFLLLAVARGLATLPAAVAQLLPKGRVDARGDWLPALLGPPPQGLGLGDQETLRGLQRLLPFDTVWPRIFPVLQVWAPS